VSNVDRRALGGTGDVMPLLRTDLTVGLLALRFLLERYRLILVDAGEVFEGLPANQREVIEAKSSVSWHQETAYLMALTSAEGRRDSHTRLDEGIDTIDAVLGERVERLKQEDVELVSGIVGSLLKLRSRARREVMAFLRDIEAGEPVELTLCFDPKGRPRVDASRRPIDP
jgi:hypothetical protein